MGIEKYLNNLKNKKMSLDNLFQETVKQEQPKTMLLFGYPKVGKTILTAGLPGDILILDFEEGTNYIKSRNGKPFNRRRVVKTLSELGKVTSILKHSEHIFDFLVLDPLTALNDTILNEYAIKLYNEQESANFPTNMDITVLAWGKGVKYKKIALKRLLNTFMPFAKTLVLTGHVTEKNAISLSGVESTIREIDFEGQLKNVISAAMDVNGLIYRAGDNINNLAFVQDNLIAGSRFSDLDGREEIISEKIDKNTLKVYWNEFFPNLADKPTIIETF